MDWSSIIENIGIVGVSAGLIVWLIKQLGQHYINKNLKVYELELNAKADNYKFKLDKDFESYKTELSIIYNKTSRLHEERMKILAELYKKIVILDRAMLEMTALLKQIYEDAEKEEQLRIKLAGDAYNDFIAFYSENKIFFSKKLAKQIDELKNKYFESFNDYTFRIRFGIKDSPFTNEKAIEASKTVRQQIPKTKEKIEDEFRNLMGVE